MNWLFLGLVGGSGLLFTIGDIFLKYWANLGGFPYLLAGSLTYSLGGVTLGYAFTQDKLIIGIVGMICFNIIAGAIAGSVVFNESMAVREWVSVIGGTVLALYISG